MKQTLLHICLILTAAMGIVQGQTLRSLADARGIHFGAAVTFPASPAVYDTTLAREFSGVVCENAMKFGNIMTGMTAFNYTAADAIVNFGISHGMYVRGHTFIWHKQVPTWFANSNVSRDSAFKIMKYYITTEMAHYKGKIKEWDIVNEAVARDSSGMRLGSGYSDATQNSKWAALTDAANHDFDYIDSAYTYARRADSSVLLFYNDYNCEGMGKKSNLVYNLVAHLKSLNLLDGIGLQCHFHLLADTGVNGGWVPSEMSSNLQRLAALGLRISFTEVDIRIPDAHTPMTAADSSKLIEQRREYRILMDLFLAQPNCKSFFIWGVNDAQSWVPEVFSGYGSALLFSNATGTNGEYVPKSDYYGLQDALLPSTGVMQTHNGVFRITPADASIRTYDLLGRKLNPLQYNQQRRVVKPGVSEADVSTCGGGRLNRAVIAQKKNPFYHK
jgi:endo-1,4-beta-xylanase